MLTAGATQSTSTFDQNRRPTFKAALAFMLVSAYGTHLNDGELRCTSDRYRMAETAYVGSVNVANRAQSERRAG